MSSSFSISDKVFYDLPLNESLNLSQIETSQMIQSFYDQAMNGSSLLGMMGASFLASVVKTPSFQVFSLFLKTPQKSHLAKEGAFLATCLAEATAMHFIPQIIQEREVLGGRVEEGWGGWVHSSLTMVLMKGVGFVLPPNLVMQHLVQDALMVKVDEVCASKGLIQIQNGSFIERMLNAEVMSCQMMVGGALVGICFTDLKRIEAKQELKGEANKLDSLSKRKKGGVSLFSNFGEVSAFAVEGEGEMIVDPSFISHVRNQREKRSLISAMAMTKDSAKSFDQKLLPEKEESPRRYAERLVEESSLGDKSQREKRSLEIARALASLLRKQNLTFLNQLWQDWGAITEKIPEGKAALVRYYSIPGVEKPIILFSPPSLFLPEHWSETLKEGLLRFSSSYPFPERLDLIGEAGFGTGYTSIVFAKILREIKGVKVQRIIGTDVNPDSWIGELNARINGLHQISFKQGDLFEPLGNQKADILFGCLPQLPHNPLLGPIDARDRADYAMRRNRFEDLFGLGDNAVAIEQAVARLAPQGRLILMLSERAGDENIEKLFTDRRMRPRVLFERIIPQAEGMDLRPMAEIESYAGIKFRFRSSDGSLLSATEASTKPAGELNHLLHVIEAKPYNAIVSEAVRAVKLEPVRWGYTEDAVTEDPKLLNAARSWLSRQLGHEIAPEVMAIGPSSQAMLEAVLKLSVVPREKIGVAGEIEEEILQKIGRMNQFRFHSVPFDFKALTQAIILEPLKAIVLKPTRRIVSDATDIEVFLKEAEKRNVLVVLFEDHPSRANDPSYTLLTTAVKDPKILRNIVCLQDLKKTGIPLPISFAIIPDSALYTAVLNYADVTYSRVSTPAQAVASRFFQSFLAQSSFQFSSTGGVIRRIESGGRSLSMVAERFQTSEVFAASPVEKPRVYEEYIDMSFGESHWIPPEGNEQFLFNPFHFDLKKEAAATQAAAAYYFNQTRDSKFTLKKMLIGSGVQPLIHATLLGIAELHGEIEVLVPTPRYGVYYPTVLTSDRIKLIRVPTSSRNRFLLTPGDIDSIPNKNKRVRVLLENVPVNPTGQYYSLEDLGLIAKEADYFLMDEVFGLLKFGRGLPFESLALLTRWDETFKERAVFYGGLSKEFALGGVRFGFAATHNEFLLDAVRKNLITEPDPFAMRAAQYFFPRWKELVERHVRYLEPKAKALTDFFKVRNFEVHAPAGGYAIFVGMHHLFVEAHEIYGEKISSDNFHELLMKHAGVKIKSDQWAGTPGYYRFVFSIDNLPEAMTRLAKFFNDIQKV